MKKYLCLLLVLAIALTFAGCAGVLPTSDESSQSEASPDNVSGAQSDTQSEAESDAKSDAQSDVSDTESDDEQSVAHEHTFSAPEYTLKNDGGKCVYYYTVTCTECDETAVVERTYTSSDGGNVEINDLYGKRMVCALPGEGYMFMGWSDGEANYARLPSLGDDSDCVCAVFAPKEDTMPVLSISPIGTNEVVYRDEYTDCTVTLTNCDSEYELKNISAGIRVRGNASSNYGDVDWIRKNKVHYRIKFGKKTSMLGLNDDAECKSWVLLRGDSVYAKEIISFYLYDELCNGRYYSSDYTFVSLYIADAYYGVYLLCEQNQINKYRVNIDEQKSGETYLMTGYFAELDQYAASEDYKFTMTYGGHSLTDMYGKTYTAPNVSMSLKNDTLTGAQVAFYKNYLENLFELCYQAIINGVYYSFDGDYNLEYDPTVKDCYECVSRYIEIGAAVAMYIDEELALERDVGVGSSFMYTDFTAKEPKLTFCAPWDFSWAYGNGYGYDTDVYGVSAWQPSEFINYAGNRSSTWFILLYQADWFKDAVCRKWSECRDNCILETMFCHLDTISMTYADNFASDAKRWNTGANQSINSQRIISWLSKRIAFLDSEWYINDNSNSDMEFETDSDGVVLKRYVGKAVNLSVMSHYDGKPVVAIASGAFKDCDTLKYVFIPRTVTRIGDGIFDGCVNLSEIAVSSSNEVFVSAGDLIIRRDDGTMVAGTDKYKAIAGCTNIAPLGSYEVHDFFRMDSSYRYKDYASIVYGEDGNDLNDGRHADPGNFRDSNWIGINKTHPNAEANGQYIVFDLDKQYSVHLINLYISNLGSAGIYAPTGVEVLFSKDGQTWSEGQTGNYITPLTEGTTVTYQILTDTDARFVKLNVVFGEAGWFFVDEIEIFGK